MDNNQDFMAQAIAQQMQGGSQESSLNEEKTQPQGTVEEQPTQTEPVAEEPAQSEKQPEPVQEATPEVQTNEEPAIDREQLFQEMLVEKTGGKFNNWEELTQMAAQPKQTELDARLAEVQEYLNKGGSFEDFVLTQATDYDGLSDLELVKEKMLIDNPEMDETDIDFLLDRKYKLDDEKFEEDEVRLSMIELKKDAKAAKTTLKELQDKLRLPDVKPQQNLSQDLEKQQQEQQAQIAEQRKQWVENINKSIVDLKEVNFTVGDQEFKHSVTDEQRANIGKLNDDLNTFFNKYQKQDGSFDYNALHQDRYKIEYFDQIMRSAVSQAKSTGAEDIIKDIKNPSVSSQAQTADTKPKSIEDQVRDILYRDIL
jgi:hypothetical protein